MGNKMAGLKGKLSVIILSLLYHSAVSYLKTGLQDTEAMAGQPLSLICITSNPTKGIQWSHYPVGQTNIRNHIYGHNKISPLYENRTEVNFDNETGLSNLTILVLQIGDAGEYMCRDDEGEGNRSYAQLIVLKGFPVCGSNINLNTIIGPNSCSIEPDQLTLSCNVSYFGNHAPSLQWKRRDVDTIPTDPTSTMVGDNYTVHNLSIRDGLQVNGALYSCETRRAPKTQYACTSGSIKVQYAFNNFFVLEKSVGEEFVCVANSSGSCNYRWIKDNVELISFNKEIKFESVGFYRCEADCKLKEKTCTVTVALVNVPAGAAQYAAQETEKTGITIALIIFVILFVCALTFILIYFLWWRPRQRRLPSDNPNAEPMHVLTSPNQEEYEALLKEAEDIRASKIRDVQDIDDLQKINEQLINRRKELGRLLYQPRPENVDYVMRAAGPITTKTTAKEVRPCKGLAIIDKELFIVSERSIDIEVYDSTTFGFKRGWAMINLVNADDLVSCPRNRCLYFSDRKKTAGEMKEILRADPNGNKITQWSVGQDYGRLSVTDSGNVVFTIYELNELREYDANGKLIHKIELSGGVIHPLHAIKLSTGHYVVSHGTGDDEVHRVCIVDIDGDVIKSFGRRPGSAIGQMNGPICLAVDSEGSIIVADCQNQRLLLLSSILEYKRILESDNGDDDFGYPVRICLNQANGRMFVADIGSGNRRLTVFDLNKPHLPDPVRTSDKLY